MTSPDPQTPPDASLPQGLELLPCPFCGSTKIDPTGWMGLTRKGPSCDECDATADSIEAWNRRALAQPRASAAVEPAGVTVSVEAMAEALRAAYDALETLANRAAIPGVEKLSDGARVTMFMADCRAALKAREALRTALDGSGNGGERGN